MEQLKKTPAQISLLSLLLHSEEHCLVLNKVLNEEHMPKQTTVNQLENMTKRDFESNAITLTNNELPKEGVGHNKALHLTLTCESYYVKRVMIDGGLEVDICPLSTLQSSKVNIDRIRPSNVFVRAYDGSRRDTIGEIKLNMTIGLVVFMIVFQVMDMETSYNFLLGRPGIHMARAVSSTLHQVVKFEYNNQEITVHGEDDSPLYRDPSVPYIEAKEVSDSVVYQSFEAVSVDRFKERESIIQSCISSSASMIAMTMLKYGYQPGKGLWPNSSKVEYDDEEDFREINRKLEQFEYKPKPNISETETINLRNSEDVKETKISLHINQEIREAIIQLLFEYKDVFAWTYDDMLGLSVYLVVHKLPVYPDFPPIQQKRRKLKPSVSVKIKKEMMKQLNAKVIQVICYTTWLANVVPVPKMDGKTRVCVDYRDLNKASPKDNFPLPNIHILIDNCEKHEMQSFVDFYAGYHQILMDEEDTKKTAFTTPWGTYCYRFMSFDLKNVGAT
ncbi:uncharacterized protein [Solanum lycopersicum]|uniref:uncharacterized protein n=1 Tax=Solanum lycopersicum TaxID=4081 RepID=UPI00374905CB